MVVGDAVLGVVHGVGGYDLADGQFSFQLYDGQQTGDGDQTKLLQTKTNDANGDVTFDKLDFDTTGTHTYSIREVVPADAVNDTKDGITYDHTWQYVQVKVTLDKETGALKTS
ncbi:hypothetical protein KIH79_04060, partial [Bifidobacterium sp. 82T10]|nr:hypothetical protein [Bifidobacterium miconis]